MTRLWCLAVLSVFSFQLAVLAQESGDPEKERPKRLETLIGQALSDAANLKLGENRAVAYARSGSSLWKADPKRARSLFQNAVDEVINAQEIAESKAKSLASQIETLNQSPRASVLNTIASRDAEFALESLYRSRPAVLQQAIAAARSHSEKVSNLGNGYAYLVQNETGLEQTLMRMAASQSPDRAVKLLKDSLSKGLSGETLNLLKQLNEKDPEMAAELAGNIIGKMVDQGFTTSNRPDYMKINFAQNVLTEYVREKGEQERVLKIDPSQARSLAEKLINYQVDMGTRSGYYSYASVLPIAEKLVPGVVPRLKQLEKTNPNRGEWGYGYDPELSKLLNSNPTTEQLLAAGKKFPEQSRQQIYQTAATKLAQGGDMSAAMGVLQENLSDTALEDAVRNLNSQYSSILLSAGKYGEAERMIDDFPEASRFYAYINLASSISGADPEKNRPYAMAVLSKARSMLPDRPETGNDLNNFTQLISVYANLDPDEGFRTFESLVPQLNELADAAAVLSGFQGSGNVKQGEFLLSQGNNFGVYVDFSSVRTLSQKDFDRAMKLIDSFSRREARILLRLQLAEYEAN